MAERHLWQGDVLIVTLAERGCVALAIEGVTYTPALDITLVDATGAGDAFNAGLMVALAANQPITQALQMACACGAWVASRAGVLQALPSLSDMTEWLGTPDDLVEHNTVSVSIAAKCAFDIFDNSASLGESFALKE